MRILIDPDAYIALYSRNDTNYAKAKETVEKFDVGKHEWFTAWDVVDEVATKLSYKLSKLAAKRFLLKLAVSNTTIIYPTDDLLGKVVSLLTKISSKNVSFTDCVNMVIYKDYSIDRVFSFDKIYVKQKIKVLGSR